MIISNLKGSFCCRCFAVELPYFHNFKNLAFLTFTFVAGSPVRSFTFFDAGNNPIVYLQIRARVEIKGCLFFVSENSTFIFLNLFMHLTNPWIISAT